ncbi:MAG: hypothetical protein ACOH2A_09125 [Sphingobacteriaceae bacterium]
MNKTKCLPLFILLSLCMNYAAAQRSIADSLKSMSYIQNEFIKVGIDLNLGGAITYIADAKKQENLINNSDWGRQVQMSFYSGPVPFEPLGKKAAPFWIYIGWNPIQSGDVAGNRSKVLKHKNTGNSLYVKCIPMHWPLDSVPGECYFESWIRLKGNTVEVRSQIVNNRPDKTQYNARGQELPAVYTNAPYHRLVSYRGEKPFTNDTLSVIKNHNLPGEKLIEWAHWQATENWAANLNEQNYGLGIWNEAVQNFSGGFYGDSTFKGGSKDSPTGYISPVNREVLDHNITYVYCYALILGSLKQIREYVYKQQPAINLPRYIFKRDRQHWVYENTTDTGWPIRNGLVINLEKGAAMVGPNTFWKAADAAILTFKATYYGKVKNARIYWRSFNGDFNELQSVAFKVIPDGKSHTYQIPLKDVANYSGTLTGLKIIPDANQEAKQGDKIKVQAVSLHP